MKRIFLLSALLLCLLWPPSAARASSPHYLNGSAGIKAATPPPPGFYYTMYNMLYTADETRDDKREKVDVDYDLTAYMLFNSFVWSSEYKIFGGRYVFELVVPLAYIDTSLEKDFNGYIPGHYWDIAAGGDWTRFGLSDIYIEPVLLTWEGERYDITAGLGIFLPTGSFDSKNPASPGKGFFTFMPALGTTLYLDEEKTWSVSALAQYEIHTEQRETDTTPGNHFHIDWGVGKGFAKYWQAGIAGYASWQVTTDSGPHARDNFTQAFAVGPEIGVFIPDWKLNVTLRSEWEFKNRSNTQGNLTSLILTYSF